MAEGAFFTRPEDVLAAEQQARAQGFGQAAGVQNPMLAGALGNLGYAASGAIGGAFGAPPQESQAVQQARTIQAITEGVDFSDRDSILDAARRASGAGFTNVAVKLVSMAPAAKETWSTPAWEQKGDKFVQTQTNALTGETRKIADTNILEQFGDVSVLRKVGDKYQIGQFDANTNKLVATWVDSEEYENMRAAEKAKSKGKGGEGRVPTEPKEDEVNTALTQLEDYEVDGVTIDKYFGGLNDEEMGELSKEIARNAKALQSAAAEQGGVLDYTEAVKQVMNNVVSGRVQLDKGFINTVNLKPIAAKADDPLGLR